MAYHKRLHAGAHAQQPHFIHRDHHGLGDGGQQDVDESGQEENLVLPRNIPEAMTRDYVRKRRGNDFVRGNNRAQHRGTNDQRPPEFGPPHLLDGQNQRQDLVDPEPLPGQGMRMGATYDHPHVNHLHGNTHANGDSPWQVSVVILVGIIVVLVFLLLNLLDVNRNIRSRPKPRQQKRISSFTTKKKKTDAWSEDEVVGAITAARAGNNFSDNAKDNDSPIMYREPGGYYHQQHHRQRKPQQVQSSAAAAITSGNVSITTPKSPSVNKVTLGDSRSKLLVRSPSSRSQQQQQQQQQLQQQLQTQQAKPQPPAGSPSVTKLIVDVNKNKDGGTGNAAANREAVYLGAGLEGFQSPSRPAQKLQVPPPPIVAGSKGGDGTIIKTRNEVAMERQVSIDLESGHPSDADDSDSDPNIGIIPGSAQRLRKTSPFNSFGSIPSPDVNEKKKFVEAASAIAASDGELIPPPLLNVSSAAQQSYTVDRSESFESPRGLRHRRVASVTSPKLSVQLGHDDMNLATPLVENKRKIRLQRESSSFDSQDASKPTSEQMGSVVPFMPNISETPEEFQPSAMPFIPEMSQDAKDADDESTSIFRAGPHVSAPKSVQIDDLHLIRMESGHGDSFGGKWSAAETDESFAFAKVPEGPLLPQPKVYEHTSYRRQETPLHANRGPGRTRTHGQIAAKAVLKQSLHNVEEDASENVDEGGNQIKHKREDLTTWSDSAASLTSPIDFDEIKLVSVIGGGGFGQVWKATWCGTPVAVKLLSMSAQTDNVPQKVLQEFVSEINLLSGMRHPNICLYLGACLTPPNRAIVTELAAHGSVWDALRQPLDAPYVAADGITRNAWPVSLYGITDETLGGPVKIVPGQQWYNPNAQKEAAAAGVPIAPSGTWPWALVKRVASGGARGMIYLHNGNPPVLHRDLKSANLLLDDSYTAKIADFGLSRVKANERSMTGNCGTVQWMSPECLASSDYAEPADVYSFGIILWELLTRECPFDGQTPIQCALAVLNKDERPVVPSWCPPDFAKLIKQCITRKPSQRPTFEQILDTLDGMD